MLKIATVCSGIGSPEQAMKNLSEEEGFFYKNVFACEYDKYPRASFEAIHGCEMMYEDLTKEEWDNPEQYSDLFVRGIPCQSFSLAGKRMGELDPRGLLFFDFYRYVKNQQPKVFIIENVKGLLSDAGGKTFQNWLLLLGNSVNSHSQIFNHEDSLGYNLHHTALNSKYFGVPQNRERVFIVGIRNDLPNNFRFPIGWKLNKRLKDVLESDVDEKYYLSEKMLNYLNTRKDNFNNGKINYKSGNDVASCINASSKSLDISDNIIVEGEVTPNSQGGKVYGTNGVGLHDLCHPITCNSFEHNNHLIEPKLKQVCQLLGKHEATGRVYDADGLYPTITAKQGGGHEPKTSIGSRIRRLTPLECWRLQGFPDEVFYKAKAVNSDTQLYKQAGNSITVSVMQEIIRNLLPILNNNYEQLDI